MMNDQIRNQAFHSSIERAERPDLKVHDIGSGSGRLAMMAARAGAAEVHSCELDPEADMGGQADLVISEIIGKDFVSEQALPSMLDAVRRLTKPDARFIPCGGEIWVALAHYARLSKKRVSVVCGFDLSPFNTFAEPVDTSPGDRIAVTASISKNYLSIRQA